MRNKSKSWLNTFQAAYEPVLIFNWKGQHRRAEVSQAANNRYFHALASVENTTSVGELADGLCRPSTWKGKRVRAINPYAPGDASTCSAPMV
ncbi:MAG TPA: hypothetical protein HPQ00_13480 [Magnetococcales bacterium]|nr:hypothetical protein [Magnetococcales bacterium]